MKFSHFILCTLISSCFSATSAMNYVPTLMRLSTDAINSKNVSPTRFVTDDFAQKHWSLYNDIGARLLEQNISDKDKVAIASHVTAKTIEGNQCQVSSIGNNLNPFLDVLANNIVKYELAPSKFLAFRKVPRLEGSITKALAYISLSNEQKERFRTQAHSALLCSLIPLYTHHPLVLARAKTSLIDNLDKAELSAGLKKIFRKEIEGIESLEEKTCLPSLLEGISYAPVIYLLSLNIIICVAPICKLTAIIAAKITQNEEFLIILNPIRDATFLSTILSANSSVGKFIMLYFFGVIAASDAYNNRHRWKQIAKEWSAFALGYFGILKISELALRGALDYLQKS